MKYLLEDSKLILFGFTNRSLDRLFDCGIVAYCLHEGPWLMGWYLPQGSFEVIIACIYTRVRENHGKLRKDNTARSTWD